MKVDFTKNIGLKIISVVAAFLLWLVVVNVDDPVISKTYTGINVELVNKDSLAEVGKDYEVLDNSDMITVVVTAKRSVIDEMSKDYIKATADIKSMTFADTVPIEVKSTRYSDRIDSVTTRAESVKLKVEDIINKTVPIAVDYSGTVAERRMLSGVDTNINNVNVRGPKSVVDSVVSLVATVDIDNLDKDTIITEDLVPVNENGNEVISEKLKISRDSVDVTFLIDTIKEIPIESGYSGTPAAGYVDTGVVKMNPSNVLVSGRGENFSDLKSVNIAPNEVSIDGATGDVVANIDISNFLPGGVAYYGADFDPIIEVTVEVKAAQHKTVDVPLSNIRIENLPEGYIASIVDIGEPIHLKVQGLGDTFDRLRGDLVIGYVDAANIVPRNIVPEMEGAAMQNGESDGLVTFELNNGITVEEPVRIMIVVDYVGDSLLSDDMTGEETQTDIGVNDNAVITSDSDEEEM